MGKERRGKNRRPSVPVAAADSGHRTSTSSGADDPGKNSTSNPNIESLEWVTCKQEERLDKFIRTKLDHLYGQAQSRLVYMGYDQDVALKVLLERGYCVGEAESLTNVVRHSLEFLTGKDIESEEDRPQPFQNLELLVNFNLHFLVYILQKYSPKLSRMSILRCILMADLNLNRAIIMNMTFDITDLLPSDLNLGEKEEDQFLALEIREMLDKLNTLDDSVSEDTRDAMIADLKKPIDDLKPQLTKRIRWASKKVAQARRKKPNMIMSLLEELRLFENSLESMLEKRAAEILSVNVVMEKAEKTIDSLELAKKGINAEISASKLIESETRQKCLEVSKKGGQLKNWDKQKVKLQGEIELEKEKISKWEQQLAEAEAAIIQADVKFVEAIKARKKVIAVVGLDNDLAFEKWYCWKRKVDALTKRERDIVNDNIERLKKLLANALLSIEYELQD